MAGWCTSELIWTVGIPMMMGSALAERAERVNATKVEMKSTPRGSNRTFLSFAGLRQGSLAVVRRLIEWKTCRMTIELFLPMARGFNLGGGSAQSRRAVSLGEGRLGSHRSDGPEPLPITDATMR